MLYNEHECFQNFKQAKGSMDRRMLSLEAPLPRLSFIEELHAICEQKVAVFVTLKPENLSDHHRST